jgi:ribosome-binding factor A
MPSRRTLKVAEAIREVVSTAILMELKDPRVQDVTVTHVEASGDLRYAKVHVSVMGSDTKQQLCLRGLQHAAGFLQSKVGDRLEMRFTPRLTFLLDQGVKKSIEVARILREVLPPEDKPGEETGPDQADAEPADAEPAGEARADDEQAAREDAAEQAVEKGADQERGSCPP